MSQNQSDTHDRPADAEPSSPPVGSLRGAVGVMAQPLMWISVRDQLPAMCVNVIVWGVQRKENISHQAWQARRFTGLNGAFAVERDGLWEWLTPCDQKVEQVTHWLPLPCTIPVQHDRHTV